MSHRNRLVASLMVGLVFAFLTWLTFDDGISPLSVGPGVRFLFGIISVLLIPGMFLGVLPSQNVHLINIWLTAAGNFIIYFGVAYFVLAKWKKSRSSRHKEIGR